MPNSGTYFIALSIRLIILPDFWGGIHFPHGDMFQHQLSECCQAVFVKKLSSPPSSYIFVVTAPRNQSIMCYKLCGQLADDRWNLVFMPRLSHTSVNPTACSRVLGEGGSEP